MLTIEPNSFNFTSGTRLKTRIVNVGDIPLGGNNPIRLQSMTNTPTLDIRKTTEQAIKIFEAGGDYVRITAASLKEAEALAEIKKSLKKQGYSFPLIADVHFNPEIAEIAAKIVEKVRINPGNYYNLKASLSNPSSEKEIILKKILPLVTICKKYGTAIRIGANHGSLSQRILQLHGNTAKGMVVSAMEFLRIFSELDFHNIVVAMKASDPRMTVYATQLLVQTMQNEGMSYPLHLGVTEAGEGEDGRIKSAIGIGSLLKNGIGDTVRVSLTEDPENEIPVARQIVDYCSLQNKKKTNSKILQGHNWFHYEKRESDCIASIGGNNPVSVFNINDTSDSLTEFIISKKENKILEKANKKSYQIISLKKLLEKKSFYQKPAFIEASANNIEKINIKKINKLKGTILILNCKQATKSENILKIFDKLKNNNCKIPVVLNFEYQKHLIPIEIRSACDFGHLLINGFGDGICISEKNNPAVNFTNLCYAILQASKTRITKTEFISCPTCGRTQFNIKKVLQEIKQATGHLKGLKIAVMGCVVNGPGEMADAHYGYVGAGENKIHLYKGKQIIKKNIPEKAALKELISLIKSYGDWVEKT